MVEESLLQRFLTSPIATLMLVFIGAAGVLQLFFSSDKSESKKLMGLVCLIIVVLMVYYRFSLWNQASRH